MFVSLHLLSTPEHCLVICRENDIRKVEAPCHAVMSLPRRDEAGPPRAAVPYVPFDARVDADMIMPRSDAKRLFSPHDVAAPCAAMMMPCRHMPQRCASPMSPAAVRVPPDDAYSRFPARGLPPPCRACNVLYVVADFVVLRSRVATMMLALHRNACFSAHYCFYAIISHAI